MATTSRRALLALAALAVGTAAGAASPKVHKVIIQDMAFGPVPASLRVGDVVEWVNADIFAHTVTGRDAAFELVLAAGARGRSVMTRKGSIPFYCRYHPGMKGTLKVD